MKQYLDLCKKIIDEGVWIENKRTGKRCLTTVNVQFEYDVSDGTLPVITTRKVFWRAAIAEMLGYIRGYDNAAQFRAIGCNTWDSNANENKDWLSNPHRKGLDDLGKIYGVQGRKWPRPDGGYVDQVRKVYNHLKAGIDDRAEIITFYNPGEFHLGALRPCMHTHTFNILENRLYLMSLQRSSDVPLGVVFNAIQVGWLLQVMAQITGLQPAKALHVHNNFHIYEDQLDIMKNVQLTREPYPLPKLKINPSIKTLEDLETWVTVDDFQLVNYVHHPAIKYPFSV